MRLTSDNSLDYFFTCLRVPGYESLAGVTYTSTCYYHEHAYPAADYSYWHRNPDKKPTDEQRKMTSV